MGKNKIKLINSKGRKKSLPIEHLYIWTIIQY